MRDHKPFVIEEFNGLWRRDPADSCPIDHFSEAVNVAFVEGGFETRPGLDTLLARGNVLRMYNYKQVAGDSLLILDTSGRIWHALLDPADTVYGPILTIAGMTDFAFHSPNSYAYISPMETQTDDQGVEYQTGMEDQFLYVYKGDGSAARKAAGDPPSISASPTNFRAFVSRFDGVISKGVHFLTVVTQANALLVDVFPVVYSPGTKEFELTNIPIGPGGTTSRKILMTRAIDPKDYLPSQASYTYYEALTIPDNTTTDAKVSIADASLTVSVALGALPTVTAMKATPSSTRGFADIGFHIIAVVYETDTGYLTALGPEHFAAVTVIDITKAISVTNIPVSPDSFVTKRHLVATKAILNFNGDQAGYQFFFIPDGSIEDNTTTTKTVSFYDIDLVEDASHLIDNFSEIPAGAVLSPYNTRLGLAATFDDPSIIYLSSPGEPEAIDQVDGYQVLPIEGTPVTNLQEFRNVLYAFKKTRTYSLVDNGSFPSDWPEPQPLDLGLGASIHGIAKVLDSDGVNVDFLLVVNISGIYLFAGVFQHPELSYKINNLWTDLDKAVDFSNIQVLNDTHNQMIYINLPDNYILVGDYKRGLNPKQIRWAPWLFDIHTVTIALVQVDRVLIGA